MRVVRISKLSTNTDAIHYEVPRRTLRAYFPENKQSKSTLGRKTVILPQQVKESSKRIIMPAQTGCPITLKIMRTCVFTYLEKYNIPNPFVKKKEMAGRSWVEGFLRHNPMIAPRKAQNLNPGRAQKLNRFIVNDYVTKLLITMEELGVMNKPQCTGRAVYVGKT
jgi:hypothetical protein